MCLFALLFGLFAIDFDLMKANTLELVDRLMVLACKYIGFCVNLHFLLHV